MNKEAVTFVCAKNDLNLIKVVTGDLLDVQGLNLNNQRPDLVQVKGLTDPNYPNELDTILTVFEVMFYRREHTPHEKQ